MIHVYTIDMKACDGDVRCNVQTYCLLHVFLYMLLMREWMYIYICYFQFGIFSIWNKRFRLLYIILIYIKFDRIKKLFHHWIIYEHILLQHVSGDISFALDSSAWLRCDSRTLLSRDKRCEVRSSMALWWALLRATVDTGFTVIEESK